MVAAIIVLYYPPVSTLQISIPCVARQVERIYVIDNTDKPKEDSGYLFRRNEDSIKYLRLGENRGLATAQNIGIRACLDAGYSHVLFLDQDSIPSGNMVQDLLEAEEFLSAANIKVAAVGPQYIDQKTGRLSYAIRYGWFRAKRVYINPSSRSPIEADWLISSGSLVRASVLREVGGMRDELFIDWIDAEWGLRSRGLGYRSFVVPKATMQHTIGDACAKMLGVTFDLHSNTRNYYIARNSAYLLRPQEMGWKWVTATLTRIPRFVVTRTWCSENKWKSFCVLMKAIADGLRGHMGQATNRE